MPVSNVAQFSPIDLSSITPKPIISVTIETVTVNASTSVPNSFDYEGAVHDLGGEILNTETNPEAIAYLMFSKTQPEKAFIVDNGIPLYPGGSSFVIPAGIKIPIFAAIAEGSARLVGNYFSSSNV